MSSIAPQMCSTDKAVNGNFPFSLLGALFCPLLLHKCCSTDKAVNGNFPFSLLGALFCPLLLHEGADLLSQHFALRKFYPKCKELTQPLSLSKAVYFSKAILYSEGMHYAISSKLKLYNFFYTFFRLLVEMLLSLILKILYCFDSRYTHKQNKRTFNSRSL